MTRPAVRFRPAARRFTEGLQPVFFVESLANGSAEIWSGRDGKVATFDLAQDATPQVLPTASKNLLSIIKQPLIDLSDPAVGDETRFFAESEVITENVSYSLITRHVINGAAYAAVLRMQEVTHTASVDYQLWSLQGAGGSVLAPVSPVLTLTRAERLDAVYELLLYSLDLEAGSWSVAADKVYEYEATPVGTGPFYVIVRNSSYYTKSLSQALTGLLPNAHPFKDCGQSIWSASETVAEPVNGTQTNVTSFRSYSRDVQRSFGSLLALDTDIQRRIIRKGLFANQPWVNELSSYQSASVSDCSLYESIDLPWADSFASYEPSAVDSREDVFADLGGLSANDQSAFLGNAYPAPGSVAPGTATAGVTTAASYFMDTSATSSLELAAGKSVYLRYWITS
jgi:hypothetical protein